MTDASPVYAEDATLDYSSRMMRLRNRRLLRLSSVTLRLDTNNCLGQAQGERGVFYSGIGLRM